MEKTKRTKNYAAGFRYFGKNLLIFGGSLIAAYEVITTAINSDSLKSMLNRFPMFEKYIYPVLDNIFLYIAIAVILALLKQGGFKSYTRAISNHKNIRISLKVCNIFDCEGGIIVPCNNLFAYDKEVIGGRSIQNQLNELYEKKKYTSDKSIGEQIENALKTPMFLDAVLPLKPQALAGRDYPIYPYGMILPIRLKKKKKYQNFYLLSMSEIKSEGSPRVTNSLLLPSIDSMWKTIEKNSLRDNSIVVPIMGTGEAKMTESNQDVIARYIIKTFADNAASLGIKHLTLCVYPGDYVNGDVNIENIRRYIDYICEFPDSEFVVTDEK